MMAKDLDFLRPLVRSVIQEFLEAEMTEVVGAEKGKRVEGRLSYRTKISRPRFKAAWAESVCHYQWE